MSSERMAAGRLLSWTLVALSAPMVAAPIDLPQLCGGGDCVVATNTTIGSASAPAVVGGIFDLQGTITVNGTGVAEI